MTWQIKVKMGDLNFAFRITQGQIQNKFEGGALCIPGAEKFSEIGDESSLYTTISDLN